MKGEELKRIRLRLGLTQVELARELDVAPNTVSRWERGDHKVPGAVVLALKTLAQTLRKKAE